ncbi:hypothetical protein AB3M93_19790 [Novosphingobium panipatense]|uniref:hypothetical protein n=1 Tax=Novosphingobium panipatense TaxID=428991 RepID=UPI0039A12E31
MNFDVVNNTASYPKAHVGGKSLKWRHLLAAPERDYVFKPHERPMMPGSPASPDHPTLRRVAYFVIGVTVGITGGLGNALVSANTQNIQGSLGLYSNQIAWLPAAYIMTNVSMSLLLVKFRQQFGLVPFARIFLPAFVAITAAHLFIHTFATALVVRAMSGIAASRAIDAGAALHHAVAPCLVAAQGHRPGHRHTPADDAAGSHVFL